MRVAGRFHENKLILIRNGTLWDATATMTAAPERVAVEQELAMATPLRQPLVVEIAPGELLDKITILEIKCERFGDEHKRQHVQAELEALGAVRQSALVESVTLTALVNELKTVNERLWEVEDALRQCERDHDFDSAFIAMARSVYQLNDYRARLKRRINEWCGSPWMEQKEYSAESPEAPPGNTIASQAGSVLVGQ